MFSQGEAVPSTRSAASLERVFMWNVKNASACLQFGELLAMALWGSVLFLFFHASVT